MSEVTITAARDRLSSLVDESRHEPVYLTRRDRTVAAIVDADLLRRLLDDAEQLAGIRTVAESDDESARLGEAAVPWEGVKRDLGLA